MRSNCLERSNLSYDMNSCGLVEQLCFGMPNAVNRKISAKKLLHSGFIQISLRLDKVLRTKMKSQEQQIKESEVGKGNGKEKNKATFFVGVFDVTSC